MTFDEASSGNSPASRDVAYHLHPYTNPAVLGEAGPHIIAQGDGVFVENQIRIWKCEIFELFLGRYHIALRNGLLSTI